MLIATRSGKINISKEKDTKLVAERLCKFINLGDFILLTGNLGVGKTTFIKYIINSLQRKNRQEISEVPSPTFNITNEYQIKKILIKHYDLYRIKNEKDILKQKKLDEKRNRTPIKNNEKINYIQFVKSLTSNVDVKVFKNTGHYISIEKPKLMNKIILEWIKKL